MWAKTTAKPDANTGGKEKWLDETKMLMSLLHNKILSITFFFLLNSKRIRSILFVHGKIAK